VIGAGLAPRPLATVVAEAAKLPAFVRRDFLVAWSYRLSFFSDLTGLVVMVATFYFVGLMVDPTKLPQFGGGRVSYLEFVIVGIMLTAFVQLALARVQAAVRTEQMQGTLESLLTTPTAPLTVQLGSVSYDFLYIPIRTGAFLAVTAALFGLDLDPGGILPAAVIVVVFAPFVWGLGVASAAVVVTFKRGTGGVALGTTLLALTSGAYFPLELFPSSVEAVAELNPMAVAIQGLREALLGGAGWSAVGRDLLVLAPMSAVTLALGVWGFRLALRRERRRGSLGLY
jgi:ABC-2 type transport system permease protein